MSGRRLNTGGLIDRSSPISFRFGGNTYRGFAGDTLASALLAEGVRLVGRSFKYHRPRGIFSAGTDEPNALVQLRTPTGSEPNLLATTLELFEGLDASPVNCWPSVKLDLAAVNSLFARFIPAGFYYKTFIWPNWSWFEGAIRHSAGLGKAPDQPDHSQYDNRWAHCETLIVGAGPAGLSAAVEAGRAGERVILVEQDTRLGGSLLSRDMQADGSSPLDWLNQTTKVLAQHVATSMLTRTTAVGYFDDNEVALIQRGVLTAGGARETLWRVRAQKVILATGAYENPLLFAGNDRPGVMSAHATQTYINRYGVLPGSSVVLVTSSDSAYQAAANVKRAGAQVHLIVDLRTQPGEPALSQARRSAIPVAQGARIFATRGRKALREVLVQHANGSRQRIKADLLMVCGGWNPAIHLSSQSGTPVVWSDSAKAFLPGTPLQQQESIGACAGNFDSDDTLGKSREVGQGPITANGLPSECHLIALGVPSPTISSDTFVDFQNDVTTADIELAVRENFVSIEHLKRYTTLGMGTDQGKTSNVNGILTIAQLTGRLPAEVGVTKFRPPFTPISAGAFTGLARHVLHRPYRRGSLHALHVAAGGLMEELGGWPRPVAYLKANEDRTAAILREALAVRNAAGLFDASPLGKVEVKGPDSELFLARMYANKIRGMKSGLSKYGLMLDESGVVLDDGVVTRLAADRFWLTTSSGNAERIFSWFQEWHDCEWPDLAVLITAHTSAVSILTISGPQARHILRAAGTDIDVSATAFPHMSYREGQIAGLRTKVFRVSFTGELSYEINVASTDAKGLWGALRDAGVAYGLEYVGVDAWQLLRTEKGYLHVGSDTDGTTVPGDIGWTRLGERSDDFIGREGLRLPESQKKDRLQLVGLESLNDFLPPVGCPIVTANASVHEGYISSSVLSPTLGRPVALARIRAGRERLGEVLILAGSNEPVRIGPVCAYDPKGERLHA